MWVAASCDAAWATLTKREQLALWLGRVEGTLGPGAECAIWHDAEVRSRHRVTRWLHGSTLGMTWDFPAEPASHVEFKLAPADEGCLLTVHHVGLAEPVEYAAGWQRHLQYFQAAVAGVDMSHMDFWFEHDARVAAYERLASPHDAPCSH